MAAYIGFRLRGVPLGSDRHYKNFRSRGGPTLLFALHSESAVRIEKFAKMTKFLFLAPGHMREKSMYQTVKNYVPRRGGEVAILWPRSSRYSTTIPPPPCPIALQCVNCNKLDRLQFICCTTDVLDKIEMSEID